MMTNAQLRFFVLSHRNQSSNEDSFTLIIWSRLFGYFATASFEKTNYQDLRSLLLY